ncbi:outer membrane protein [Endozoicomonas sp.]|uniref:outer membrane protein n=1 Tax=Endozoicomonas sp. TaxID=1892382 RepID=UPI003AF47BB3
MKTLNAILGSLVLAIPATSHAMDIYAFARGGAAYTEIKDTEATNPLIPFGTPDWGTSATNGSLGIVKESNSNSATLATLGFGLVINSNFRLELEGSSQRKNDFQIDLTIGTNTFTGDVVAGTGFNNISIQSEAYLLKAYYDMPINKAVSPYFMAGLGYTRNKASGVQTFSANPNWNEKWDDNTNNEMAWTVGIGLSYSFSKHLALDLGVEHRNLGNWELKNLPATGDESFKGKLESSNVLMGLRYHF